jgi:uncharacterized protein (DUF362 family)
MIELFDNIESLKEAFDKWLEQKGICGKKILIKPNAGYPKSYPYTTSLKLVEAIVSSLYAYSPKKIDIAEGSTTKSSALENFQKLGFLKKLAKYKVNFIDLNTLQSNEVKLMNEVTHFLPTALRDYDIRISMPIIKFYDDDQGKTFLSNAIKNFFGLPPKKEYQTKRESHKRDRLHDNLHRSVMEIYLAVEKFAPFNLYICDGLEVLYGEGQKGSPQRWGKILMGDDALEIDLQVLELLQRSKPEYLELLIAR